MRKLLLILLISCIVMCACSINEEYDDHGIKVTPNQDKENSVQNFIGEGENGDRKINEANNLEPAEVEAGDETNNVKADGFYVEVLIDTFENLMVDAVNENNYERIKRYLSEDNRIHELVQNQITEWNERCEKVELISYDIREIVRNDDESYTVYLDRVWSITDTSMDNKMLEESKKYTVEYNGEIYVVSNVEDYEK